MTEENETNEHECDENCDHDEDENEGNEQQWLIQVEWLR
jgi:hypothetical protein